MPPFFKRLSAASQVADQFSCLLKELHRNGVMDE
jgi:hypothetical protein